MRKVSLKWRPLLVQLFNKNNSMCLWDKQVEKVSVKWQHPGKLSALTITIMLNIENETMQYLNKLKEQWGI